MASVSQDKIRAAPSNIGSVPVSAEPTFKIARSEAIDDAIESVTGRIEELTFNVEGVKKDFERGKLLPEAARNFLVDREMLAVARKACAELSTPGEFVTISATTLEFVRCEISKRDLPQQKHWLPSLPGFDGKYFSFNRCLEDDANAIRIVADNNPSLMFTFPKSLGADATRTIKESAALVRHHLLDQLFIAYARGESFAAILKAFERAANSEPRLDLRSSGFDKFKIRKSQLSEQLKFAQLRAELSERFDFSGTNLICGVEPVVIKSFKTGETRELNLSEPLELELDRLCSRALIEEVMHSIQTVRFTGSPSKKADRTSLCLSKLTEQYIKETGNSHYSGLRSGGVRPENVLDESDQELKKLGPLMEVDVLALFVEKWLELGIPLTDLDPEMNEFHSVIRKPFVEWLQDS